MSAFDDVMAINLGRTIGQAGADIASAVMDGQEIKRLEWEERQRQKAWQDEQQAQRDQVSRMAEVARAWKAEAEKYRGYNALNWISGEARIRALNIIHDMTPDERAALTTEQFDDLLQQCTLEVEQEHPEYVEQWEATQAMKTEAG